MKKDKQPKLPTPEQEAWLKQNYKMYNRVHLCEHLKIRDKELSAWFKLLKLKKRDARTIVVTDEQAAFIENNFKKMKHEKMAIALGISLITVQAYCRRNGLRKIKQVKEIEFPRQPKEIITFEPKAKPQRPRADHTNISREQHVQKWLNYQI